jgi:hypothetical protein
MQRCGLVPSRRGCALGFCRSGGSCSARKCRARHRVNGPATGDERERISLTYQRIELTDLDSNTTAEDEWLVDR